MKKRIEKFINRISYSSDDGYCFHGDGMGDFQEGSKKTTEECLIKYIVDCKKQTEISELILKDFKKLYR